MERSKPTAEDARLVMELVKMATDERSTKASRWFFNEFIPKKITDYVEYRRQYPMGSEEAGYIGNIVGWFELAGAMIENGVLNEDLFFDACAPPRFFWEPIKAIIYGERAEMKEPRIGENFELLYERHKAWLKNHPPKIKLVTA
jgi:hypothetical protein